MRNGKDYRGERESFQSSKHQKNEGWVSKECKRIWGRDGKRKEKMVVKKKKISCRREGEGRQAVSAAVLFFKSCQHIYNVLSIPLLIYWAMHTKEKESNRTEAAEDSLRHRTEVP